jgi:hypothetical protein
MVAGVDWQAVAYWVVVPFAIYAVSMDRLRRLRLVPGILTLWLAFTAIVVAAMSAVITPFPLSIAVAIVIVALGITIIESRLLTKHYGQAMEDKKALHAKLDDRHAWLRSELKVRVPRLVGPITRTTVFLRLAEASPDDPLNMLPWHTNRADAHKDMIVEYNTHRNEIGQVLSDFETCGLSVPAEIRKLTEGFDQRVDGIEALVHYMTNTVRDL